MTTSDRTSYAVGFADLDEEVAVDSLPVTGVFPQWLSGTLLRTGPAKYDIGATTVNHWFDGLAMLHRFGFDDGRVSYRNRFLRSETYLRVRSTKAPSHAAALPPTPAARSSSASPPSSIRRTPTTATSISTCSAARRLP